MAVILAYLSVILIWSTTPLAIKWSMDANTTFIFGVAARMIISVSVCAALLVLFRQKFQLNRTAFAAYSAAGAGAYFAMICVYWGAQFIPTGLVSVLFGFTPFATALFAAWVLQENSFTMPKITGMILGATGLVFIFWDSLAVAEHAVYGIVSVLASVLIHSISTVYAKRYTKDIPALNLTTGALALAVPLYIITWFFLDGTIPHGISDTAIWSIVYLGVFGSAFGFILYYYVLKKLETASIALITLVTPITAMMIGVVFNNEILSAHALTGVAIILSGLLSFHWREITQKMVRREVIQAKETEL
ncbi:MAG: DMT family transporter [Gammaproteobacteria bacterium]|nr:DMT family transporter [Gammaproteobacteria bacterium]